MSAKTDYPMVERGLPQWEAMVDEIDALRRANEALELRPIVLTGFPALLGKGDRFYDASTNALWEVVSTDEGVLWVPVDLAIMPDPDSCPSVYLAGKSGMLIHTSTHGWINVVNPPAQEVTAMQPITETWWSVDNLALRDDGTVSVAVHDAQAVPTDSGYVPGFSFIVPLEMAPRIGEVITMSWGAPL